MSHTLLQASPRKRISLTPLIDVVFILLMFFMLTSTFNQWKAIDLISAAASAEATVVSPDTFPQLLVLHADGLLSLKGTAVRQATAMHALSVERVALSSLRAALDLAAPVVVLPEALANVQTIVATLEALKAAGADDITLGNALPAGDNPGPVQVTP
ncbi:biopolymer transporter ExbD [Aestuariicella hydrocarbonica]|uniref:Biopolymer transporter ExbD n=1 Tax=Pseudomaricurvus hydrocarbonicus TaxID=1470433 RepID=A0A9E5JQX5_9GAMM|nr:biopolymer transporter ExbD [Aestuariicella hydrocarbonica]NHO64859.1 biopolymer transporter ExbD [Aestuariicella hydrocarbonica]